MARYVKDEFGQRFQINEDGSLTPAPELSEAVSGRNGIIDNPLVRALMPNSLETIIDSPQFGAMMVSAGKETDDILRGITQIAGGDPQASAQQGIEAVSEEFPLETFAGAMLPELAVTSNRFLGNVGLGALSGALNYDAENPSVSGRAVEGAAFGAGGDLLGRTIGRIVTTAQGLADDIYGQARRLAGKGAPIENPAAQRVADLGGETLAFQRMAPGEPGQELAERMAQYSAASGTPHPSIAAASRTNQGVMRDMAMRATGENSGRFEVLDEAWAADRLDYFDNAFEQIENMAYSAGDFTIPAEMGKRLSKIRQIRELNELEGLFDGLEQGRLNRGEFTELRKVLAEQSANRAAAGEKRAAQSFDTLIEDLDAQMTEKLGPEFVEGYAQLREQYRVFKLLERPGVINYSTGELNPTRARQVFRADSGFGRSARAQQAVNNQETRDLIDGLSAFGDPAFTGFKSSGTAENLAGRDAADNLFDAAYGLSTGDLMGAGANVGKLVMPYGVGAAQTMDGRMFQGAMTPANPLGIRVGGAAGRAELDNLFYPFVGREDERRP